MENVPAESFVSPPWLKTAAAKARKITKKSIMAKTFSCGTNFLRDEKKVEYIVLDKRNSGCIVMLFDYSQWEEVTEDDRIYWTCQAMVQLEHKNKEREKVSHKAVKDAEKICLEYN